MSALIQRVPSEWKVEQWLLGKETKKQRLLPVVISLHVSVILMRIVTDYRPGNAVEKQD